MRILGGLAVDGTELEDFEGRVRLSFGAVFFEAYAIVSLSAIFILGQLPLNDFIPSAALKMFRLN